MIQLSEQQAFELQVRCEAIREQAKLQVFVRIEKIIIQAISAQQITNEDVVLLNNLLNSIAEKTDNSKHEEQDSTESEWKDIPYKEKKEWQECKDEKDRHAHVLLSHRETIRNVESFRRCLSLIVLPAKNKLLEQDHF